MWGYNNTGCMVGVKSRFRQLRGHSLGYGRFRSMLSFDDERWNRLKGGYRTPFDPHPLLRKLENGEQNPAVWHELWGELHHQGDVGEASYAAVPHIVEIHRKSGVVDWNPYAIVACIESARTAGNPEI